ncbi:hypothetical protein B0J17DRAFT_719496 [Rhizoctonia solani]|nr:hypothetical protein B0J17DRAFT_719496 [Rhizoctonia solani]
MPLTPTVPETPTQVKEWTSTFTEGTIGATNNAGIGSDTVGASQTPEPTFNVDICELMEQSNQLFGWFNQLLEQSTQPTQKANELAEQLNEFANQANQLSEQLNQLHEHSNPLSEQVNKTWEQLRDMLGNMNRMLMQIQHTIVRNHKGNTISALDCLANEKGKTQPDSNTL